MKFCAKAKTTSLCITMLKKIQSYVEWMAKDTRHCKGQYARFSHVFDPYLHTSFNLFLQLENLNRKNNAISIRIDFVSND